MKYSSSLFTLSSVVRSGNDGNFCAVNPSFLAIVADTTFVVIPIAQTGRIDFQCCKVIGHTGQILDLKWNPFNDNIIASGSDDCTVSKKTEESKTNSNKYNLNDYVHRYEYGKYQKEV